MKSLHKKLKIIISVVTALTFALCIGFWIQVGERSRTVVVGGKGNAEQYLISEMCAQLLEAQTDLKIVRRFNLEGTSICFESLRSNSIDLYCEYTGTAFLEILKEREVPKDLYAHVKKTFEERYGIIWLDRLGYSNHYVLIARADSGLRTFSDVAKDPTCKLGVDPEVATRLEMEQLREAYPRKGGWDPVLIDQTLLYLSLQHGGVDVMTGAVTDGRLADPLFVVLEDDQKCFLRYESAPLVTRKCLNAHPEVGKALAMLSGILDHDTIKRLNVLSEYEGIEISEIVREFLGTRGLLTAQIAQASSQSL